jgi:hypothetical protein
VWVWCLKKEIKWKWELNLGCLHHILACYQLNYCGWHERQCFRKTYQHRVKQLENKFVYYKETAECQHLIFCSGSWERVHSILQNWRVTIDQIPLLMRSTYFFTNFYSESHNTKFNLNPSCILWGKTCEQMDKTSSLCVYSVHSVQATQSIDLCFNVMGPGHQ